MKQLIYTLGLFFIGLHLVTGQTQTENYIQSTAYQVSVQTETVADNLPADDKIETITYYDGLGRPIQSIARQNGGQKQDIIIPIVYDEFNRQVKDYLPYARTNSTLDLDPNLLPINGEITLLNNQYLNNYASDLDPNTPNPFSQKSLEASPLNRILEQAGPGKDWALTSEHTIKFEYNLNTASDKIPLYRVFYPTGNPEQPDLYYDGFYAPDELYKTITKDENWTATQTHLNDHTIEEFIDKQGHVILKRTYNNNIVHDTQYIYDAYGNLVYVLSPKGSDLVLAQVKIKNSSTTVKYKDFIPQDDNTTTGSGSAIVTVDSASNSIMISFNLTFSANIALRTGPIAMIDSNLPNMIIGHITSSGYNYQVSIIEGYLHLSGGGTMSSQQDTISTTLPSYTIDNDALDELCYQYRYDYRNRLVEKKIPQKGWEYIIYDKLDRPVLTQDANLRTNNHWLFTKYDVFGRVVYTGKLLNLDDDRVAFQDRVNNQTVLHETPSASLNMSISGYEMYYTNLALQFPNAAVSYDDLYTINYYDSYNAHLTDVATDPGTVYGISTTNTTKTLTTGSRVKVLDDTGSHWVTSVSYYDDKARPIYAASHNSLLASTDVVKTELDFTGKVVQTESTHTRGATTIVVHDAFTYDHAARLLTQVQTIDSGTPELIVNNHYDELGQLVSKDVGGVVSTDPTQSNGLQSVDYSYNIRGWLKTINDLDALGNDLFGFKLNYNTTDHTNGTALYNGNISESLWRTANTDPITGDIASKRSYTYEYDALNRIVNGDFYKEEGTNQNDRFNLKFVTYDKNGNILSLGRSGLNDIGNRVDNMDDLLYGYNGNQLIKVTDKGNLNHGVKAATSDYLYDDNGNMTEDSGKGITKITYNHLNLPHKVWVGNDDITYIYDATGIKLQKLVTENSNTNTTDYAGNYIYKDGNLEFFSHPEGYVESDVSGYNYVYQYKDHLGNIRLSYSNPNDSYQNIIDSDFTNSMDGWEHNGNVTSEFINGSLKVTVDSAWEGIKHSLDDLSVAPGDVFNVRLTFDKGTTQANIRLYFQELDANDNHLSWNVINGDLQTGNHHNYNYTVNAGSKLKLRIDKHNTHTQDVTHFFVDHVSVTSGNLEVVEENNYYPFGLKHKGYNNVVNSTNIAQNYKYSGKQLNKELGLDWYDFGARNYDVSLGRWMNIDPLAEKYYSHSTYNFTLNNPVRFIDPNGMYVIMWFNKQENALYIVDLDHWDNERETKTVEADKYIHFEKGKSTHNQILKISDVFTGGNNINETTWELEEDIEYAETPNQLAIPNGVYDLLEYNGKGTTQGWYKVDKNDENRYNDKAEGYKNAQGTTRGNFRLHIGSESWGCITVCEKPSDDRKRDWDVLDKIIQNTSHTEVPNRQGREKYNPFSYIKKYGSIIVSGENPKGETPKND